jgi:release factor glutamine methyltransferase
LTVLEGVYPPSEDSFLLMGAIEWLSGVGKALDLCCGTGAVGLSIAHRVRQMVAVDINPIAVKNTVINYKDSGLSERLDATVGDLFSPLRGKVFDLVIMNPPYVDDLGRAGDLSWSGGRKGRRVIDHFLDTVGAFLSPGGRAAFIQSDLNGLQETLERARGNGLVARVIGERVFRFESLLAMEVRAKEVGQKD